jgi:hypothetical protein
MCGPLDSVDLYSTRPTFGVQAAEPDMVLARPVNQTLEARRQIFSLSAHALSVSIRRIERRIWVETGPALLRYA